MELSMRLAARPQQILALECPVCGQWVDPDDMERAGLFRWALPYGVCSGCFQEVRPPHNRAYKIRHGKRLRERQAARRYAEAVARGEYHPPTDHPL